MTKEFDLKLNSLVQFCFSSGLSVAGTCRWTDSRFRSTEIRENLKTTVGICGAMFFHLLVILSTAISSTMRIHGPTKIYFEQGEIKVFSTLLRGFKSQFGFLWKQYLSFDRCGIYHFFNHCCFKKKSRQFAIWSCAHSSSSTNKGNLDVNGVTFIFY